MASSGGAGSGFVPLSQTDAGLPPPSPSTGAAMVIETPLVAATHSAAARSAAVAAAAAAVQSTGAGTAFPPSPLGGTAIAVGATSPYHQNPFQSQQLQQMQRQQQMIGQLQSIGAWSHTAPSPTAAAAATIAMAANTVPFPLAAGMNTTAALSPHSPHHTLAAAPPQQLTSAAPIGVSPRTPAPPLQRPGSGGGGASPHLPPPLPLPTPRSAAAAAGGGHHLTPTHGAAPPSPITPDLPLLPAPARRPMPPPLAPGSVNPATPKAKTPRSMPSPSRSIQTTPFAAYAPTKSLSTTIPVAATTPAAPAANSGASTYRKPAGYSFALPVANRPHATPLANPYFSNPHRPPAGPTPPPPPQRVSSAVVVSTPVSRTIHFMPPPDMTPTSHAAAIAAAGQLLPPMEAIPPPLEHTDGDSSNLSIPITVNGRQYWIPKRESDLQSFATGRPPTRDGFDDTPISFALARRLLTGSGSGSSASSSAAAAGGGTAAAAALVRRMTRTRIDPSEMDAAAAFVPDIVAAGLRDRAPADRPSRRWRHAWATLITAQLPKEAAQLRLRWSENVTRQRRVSVAVVAHARKRANKQFKASRDVLIRTRRGVREMQSFWRKSEKEVTENKKRAKRTEEDKRKKEEERREVERQQRKLEFLLKQTELVSHFIGSKMGIVSTSAVAPSLIAAAASATANGAAAVAPTSTAAGSKSKSGSSSVSAVSKIGDPLPDQSIAAQAEAAAQQYIVKHTAKTAAFERDYMTAKQTSEMESAKWRAEQAKFEKKTDGATSSAQPTVTAPEPSAAPSADSSSGSMDLLNPSTMLTPADSYVREPAAFKGKLKEYQLKGLNWLVSLYEQGINGILADEMGLGKTIQTIAFMAHLASVKDIWGPFLVVAPTSTVHQWQQELKKFAPELKVLPYWGQIKERKVLRRYWNPAQLYTREAPFHVLVTSYHVIVADDKYFMKLKWQFMILDEAQAIKNASSQRWNVLLNLKCRNRLLLTGTPIQNNLSELWSLLHFIHPDFFDSHEEFNEWFSKDISSHASGDSASKLTGHQLQRLHMILKPFMLRRVKKDVENEMPPKIELKVNCFLSQTQKLFYSALQNQVASRDDRATGAETLLNLVMQFRKLCNHPELFHRRGVTSPFQFSIPWSPPPITPFKDDPEVWCHGSASAYTNPIVLAVPRLMADQLIRPAALYGDASAATGRSELRWNRFSIWHADYIHRSLFPADSKSGAADQSRVSLRSAFSFLRFIDLSSAEASFMFWCGLIERWLIHVVATAHRSHQLRFYHSSAVLDSVAHRSPATDAHANESESIRLISSRPLYSSFPSARIETIATTRRSPYPTAPLSSRALFVIAPVHRPSVTRITELELEALPGRRGPPPKRYWRRSCGRRIDMNVRDTSEADAAAAKNTLTISAHQSEAEAAEVAAIAAAAAIGAPVAVPTTSAAAPAGANGDVSMTAVPAASSSSSSSAAAASAGPVPTKTTPVKATRKASAAVPVPKHQTLQEEVVEEVQRFGFDGLTPTDSALERIMDVRKLLPHVHIYSPAAYAVPIVPILAGHTDHSLRAAHGHTGYTGWERSVLLGTDVRAWSRGWARPPRPIGLSVPASLGLYGSSIQSAGLMPRELYRPTNRGSPTELSAASLTGYGADATVQPSVVVPGLLEPTFDWLGSSMSDITVPYFGQLLADSGKLIVLDMLLKKLKREGHRVLIFSQMTKMMNILEDYMRYRKHKFFKLDGSTALADRRDMVAEFQANHSYFVFLLSTRAGGLGINLATADTVIFYDNDWNPTMDAQAMDRVHRIGQTRQVSVYRLVCAGTVEERILEKAHMKFTIQKTVYSGGFGMKAGDGAGGENMSNLFRAAELKDIMLAPGDASAAGIASSAAAAATLFAAGNAGGDDEDRDDIGAAAAAADDDFGDGENGAEGGTKKRKAVDAASGGGAGKPRKRVANGAGAVPDASVAPTATAAAGATGAALTSGGVAVLEKPKRQRAPRKPKIDPATGLPVPPKPRGPRKPKA